MTGLHHEQLIQGVFDALFIRVLDGNTNEMRFECNYCTADDYMYAEQSQIGDLGPTTGPSILTLMSKHLAVHHPEHWDVLLDLDGTPPVTPEEEAAAVASITRSTS